MGEPKVERDVFTAIADPTRREIVHILSQSSEMPLHELTPHFEIGRTAISKHLKVLREADLVKGRRIGRETKYTLNPEPLKEVKDWLLYYERFWSENAGKLKELLEE